MPPRPLGLPHPLDWLFFAITYFVLFSCAAYHYEAASDLNREVKPVEQPKGPGPEMTELEGGK